MEQVLEITITKFKDKDGNIHTKINSTDGADIHEVVGLVMSAGAYLNMKTTGIDPTDFVRQTNAFTDSIVESE